MPIGGFIHQLSTTFCTSRIGAVVCEYIYYGIFGFSPGEMNKTLVPILSLQMPSGGSIKQYIHYLQEINSGDNFKIFIDKPVL